MILFQRAFAASLTALTVVLASPAVQAADASDYARFTASTVETYIRPATKDLANAFTALEKETRGVCAQPTADTRRAFNSAFNGAVVALASIDFFRFGPLGYNNASHRLAFLPDSRSVVRRQVTKAIAKKDTTVTTPASLAGKSVALQGLTALERVAYTAQGELLLGSAENAAFLCGFAQSIAANLSQTAQEVEANWADVDGFSKILLTPTAQGGVVQTHKEAAELVYNAVKTALELNKDQYLLATVGKSVKKAKPAKAPFARSGNAIAYLSASLTGIEAAVLAGGYLDTLDSEQNWVTNSFSFEFKNARRALAAVPQPLRESGKEPEVRDQLIYIITILRGLREVMNVDLAGYLGLAGGFNALDGD